MSVVRDRSEIRESNVEGARRWKDEPWARAILNHPEHYIDAEVVFQAREELREINLNRWTPETRWLIRKARAAALAAARAMWNEARERFQ